MPVMSDTLYSHTLTREDSVSECGPCGAITTGQFLDLVFFKSEFFTCCISWSVQRISSSVWLVRNCRSSSCKTGLVSSAIAQISLGLDSVQILSPWTFPAATAASCKIICIYNPYATCNICGALQAQEKLPWAGLVLWGLSQHTRTRPNENSHSWHSHSIRRGIVLCHHKHRAIPPQDSYLLQLQFL